MRLPDGVRAVAVFEAAKGGLVLVVGFGLLSLIHHNAQQIAEQIVGHLHLNPANRYPRVFIDAAASLTESRAKLLAIGAVAYALMRFVEAYGLWRERRWAEWLAVISGGVYIPFEIYELHDRVGWLAFGALSLNSLVVVLMARVLAREVPGADKKAV